MARLFCLVAVVAFAAQCGCQRLAPPRPGGNCGDAPKVNGSIVQVFRGRESPIANVSVAIYNCDLDRTTVGDKTIFCLPGNKWATPPVCQPKVSSSRRLIASIAASPPIMAVSRCTNQDEVDTYDCEPVLMYRYNSEQNRCKAIAVCADSETGVPGNAFDSRFECMMACSPRTPSPSVAASSTTPGPAVDLQNNSGGSKGANCIDNVDPSTHSSCLADSTYLLTTIPFVVDYALEPHNLWRRFTSPPARDMPMLEWNNDLAITAERWAAQCPMAGETDSMLRSIPGFGYIGQSVCLSRVNQKSWKDCITEWASQRLNWDYVAGAINGNGDSVKNYVQLVWGNAKYIGCGIAQCINTSFDYVMVCNYGAPTGPGGPRTSATNPNPYAKPYDREFEELSPESSTHDFYSS